MERRRGEQPVHRPRRVPRAVAQEGAPADAMDDVAPACPGVEERPVRVEEGDRLPLVLHLHHVHRDEGAQLVRGQVAEGDVADARELVLERAPVTLHRSLDQRPDGLALRRGEAPARATDHAHARPPERPGVEGGEGVAHERRAEIEAIRHAATVPQARSTVNRRQSPRILRRRRPPARFDQLM